MKANKKLSAVDLFCGAGGMSTGFNLAGFDMVAAFDNWMAAIETYRSNVADHAFNMDLTDTASTTQLIKEINPDVIVGGPPCQDFSTAGNRVEGERADLTRAFAEIVVGSKPKLFLMENVPQARKRFFFLVHSARAPQNNLKNQ